MRDMETQRLLPERSYPASLDENLRNYQSAGLQNDSTGADTGPETTSSDADDDDRLSPYRRKLLLSLILVTVMNGSLIAVMIPFFPVEAASRGVSQTVISGVFSCFAVARMLFNPLMGRLAPLVGVTRLYNMGLAFTGLTTLLFGTLSHIRDTDAFMAAIFAVRITEAAGSAALSISGYTIAGSQFGSLVTTAVAAMGSARMVGMAFTPAIWGGLYAIGGFGTPFYTLGITMLIMAAVNSRLMPPIAKSDCEQVPFFRMLAVFAGSVENWLCLVTIFVFAVDFTSIESLFAVYANDVLNVPPSLVGLFFLVATSLYALINVFWAWLSERVATPFPMMSACLLAASAGILLIAPSPFVPLQPHWLITGAGLSIQELFIGGAYTPTFKAMLDASRARGLRDNLSTKAFVSSMLHVTFSLGVAVGPVSGGAVTDRYRFATMTACTGLMTLLMGIVVALKVVLTRCRTGRWA